MIEGRVDGYTAVYPSLWNEVRGIGCWSVRLIIIDRYLKYRGFAVWIQAKVDPWSSRPTKKLKETNCIRQSGHSDRRA